MDSNDCSCLYNGITFDNADGCRKDTWCWVDMCDDSARTLLAIAKVPHEIDIRGG